MDEDVGTVYRFPTADPAIYANHSARELGGRLLYMYFRLVIRGSTELSHPITLSHRGGLSTEH